MKALIAAVLLLASPSSAQVDEETRVAREILESVQELSFRKRREYCGFIGYNANGELVASDPVPGTQASCGAAYPVDLAVVASWHTHGAFDRGYFNEIPSDIDIESDSAALLNGYVSTPGGRFWFIDGRTQEAHLLCGPGCLPVAPGFFKGLNGEIADHYTLEEIRDVLGD